MCWPWTAVLQVKVKQHKRHVHCLKKGLVSGKTILSVVYMITLLFLRTKNTGLSRTTVEYVLYDIHNLNLIRRICTFPEYNSTIRHVTPPQGPGSTQIAKFVGRTWGPPGSCRPQMGPMLAPWTLLSGQFTWFLWFELILSTGWNSFASVVNWYSEFCVVDFVWENRCLMSPVKFDFDVNWV